MIIDMPTVSMGNTSGSILPADKVSYDNTTSGLEAENVQDAIDEVKEYKIGDRIWICENGVSTKNCSGYAMGYSAGATRPRFILMLSKDISSTVTGATLHVEGGNAQFDCFTNQDTIPVYQMDANWFVVVRKDNIIIACNSAILLSGSFTAASPFYIPILRSDAGTTPTTCNIYVELT